MPPERAAVDTEAMIVHVQARPLLWDSSCDLYRDRFRKRAAWLEICSALYPLFFEYPEETKIAILRRVMQRWRSVRDGYVRHTRALKQRDAGIEIGRKTNKDYVYFRHLSFLSRVTDIKEDCLDSFWDRDTTSLTPGQPMPGSPPHQEVPEEDMRVEEEVVSDNETVPEALDCVAVEMSPPDKQHTAEPPPPYRDDDWAFFSSLVPLVRKLGDDQKLEFRLEILNALKKVKRGTKPISPPDAKTEVNI